MIIGFHYYYFVHNCAWVAWCGGGHWQEERDGFVFLLFFHLAAIGDTDRRKRKGRRNCRKQQKAKNSVRLPTSRVFIDSSVCCGRFVPDAWVGCFCRVLFLSSLSFCLLPPGPGISHRWYLWKIKIRREMNYGCLILISFHPMWIGGTWWTGTADFGM